jgi:heme exporter protein D
MGFTAFVWIAGFVGLCGLLAAAVVGGSRRSQRLRAEFASLSDEARLKRDTEDPARLAIFLAELRSSDWTNNAGALAALQTARDGAGRLAQYEMSYYFRKRRRSGLKSILYRFVAWSMGLIGVLSPLIAPIHEKLNGLKDLGYAAFAVAGALLLANELFGGTRAHIRYINAQLTLERLTIGFAVNWEAWRAVAVRAEEGTVDVERGLALIEQYLTAISDAVAGETAAWSETLQKALENLSASARKPDA